MIGVHQTRFGDPLGNCLPACVVSILEKPDKLDELSDFMQKKTDWSGQQLLLAEWLVQFDMTCIPMLPWEDRCEKFIEGVICIAGGRSPRGTAHSVVWRTNLLFDPHPDGGGIDEPDSYVILINREFR